MNKIKVVGLSDSGHYQNEKFDIRACHTSRGFFKGHGTGKTIHSGWTVYDRGTYKVRKYCNYLKDAKQFVIDNS